MNRIILIGNICAEPNLTETANGIKISRFTIAVNRSYKNADGETLTDFFNCIAWRGVAETVARYTHKGDKVAVSGAIELRNYEDKQGIKRTAIDINVGDIEFLVQKQSGSNNNNGDNGKRTSEQGTLIPFDDDSDIPF